MCESFWKQSCVWIANIPLSSLHELENKFILLLQFILSSFRGAVQTKIPLWSENYKNVLKMCPSYGLSHSMLWGGQAYASPAELFYRPRGSRQPFPAMFRQSIALCRHRQSGVYWFFFYLFFLFQQQSLCINMFSFQPDEYVTFQLRSVKSVKFTWHVKVKFTPS